MARSASSNRLACAVLLGLSALAVASGFFYGTQNATARIGGPIAPQKAMWLVYAIALWGVIPLAISLDARAAVLLRRAFGALFVLMLVRAPVELWMLYQSRNWSPWYGIAHDLTCAGVLALFLLQAARTRAWRFFPNGWLAAHLAVTTAAFTAEIYFAHYMTRHFVTAGDAAIYFVPAEARHGDVLGVTTAVVAALSLYLPAFLWGWLFGASGSKHTRPR
ncbi:MAG: hypothetical protein EHM59_10655 [Betaproteobacteria bacterium]|nr:MAG: hypothetical protein EHM59_10655 [Betaproteobacteria bacterium]